MGEAALNCGYGCTTVGILKIVSIVIGLLVVILLFTGYRQAAHFNSYRSTQTPGNCKAYGTNNEKNCPKRWMIIVPGWICFLALVISLIGLIIMLSVYLRKDIFRLMDFVYHILFGILIIFAGIFALCYACLAYALNECDEGKDDGGCGDKVEAEFKPSFILAASLFAIVNGIIYIIIGCMVRRQRHHHRRRVVARRDSDIYRDREGAYRDREGVYRDREVVYREPEVRREVVHRDPEVRREVVHREPEVRREVVHQDPEVLRGREVSRDREGHRERIIIVE